MAKYLMIVLKREGSAHIFVAVLLYQLPFHNFYAYTCMLLVSSPEPLGSQCVLIVYPCSGVRRGRCRCCRCHPPFSNVFSSETAWPIKAKFYVELPWEGGTKVCINGLGHMTKMAAMPIYGKTLKNLLLQNRQADFHETWYVAL